ncbi:CD1D protein, partial [Tachuris rubrigastra]|nr:CD1D protein [Tachuris rubrigastra]
VLQYFLTGLFSDISSAELSAVAVLGDVPIFTLDPGNWSIHFHWPWVSQAAAEGDTKKLMSQRQIALRSVIRYVHEKVQQTEMDYPLVIQIRGGCELYPNMTSWGFLHIGEGGEDLVTFEVYEQRWEVQQQSQMAEQVIRDLNRQRSIKVLLEYLMSVICQSQIRSLNKYGRATLERQELPVATVFARTPSPHQLLLVCHVTAFYPRPISVAWLRDGQEVPPGPELNTSPILPNADLTYQLYSVLAVAPQDGHSYACRVRHRSLGTRSLLIPWG